MEKNQTIEWESIESSLSEGKDVYQIMEQYITIKASLKNKLDGLKSKKETHYLIKNIDTSNTNTPKTLK